MVSYHYLDRFLIDKLVVRSRNAEISSSSLDEDCKSSEDCQQEQQDHSSLIMENNNKENSQQLDEKNQDNKKNKNSNNNAKNKVFESSAQLRQLRSKLLKQQSVNRSRFAILDSNMSGPSVLYATTSTACLMLFIGLINQNIPSGSATAATTNNFSSYLSQRTSRESGRAPPLIFPNPISSLDWRRIGSALVRQLPIGGGGSGNGGHGTSSTSNRFPLNRVSPLTRVTNRLRQRIGARNTIRVHNAFRDFAWRILSGLSMPTPVIYELRRQNFYPAEEDSVNDNFYNRNTSKTIRSKRFIDSLNLLGSHHKTSIANGLERRAGKRANDDDDEAETFRDRLRSRLEDVLSLSRRSLFGRVIRLPALFPFKRQEDEDNDNDDRSDNSNRSEAQLKKSTVSSSFRPRLISLSERRKKRRDADRQMISINGKQYYVDDDGELKEWKERR